MNEQRIKSFIAEAYQPVFDKLIDMTFAFYDKVLSGLPKDMPDEQKLQIIEPMIKAQADQLKASYESIDIDKIAKEIKSGRKS